MAWTYRQTIVVPWMVASSGTKIYVLQRESQFRGDDIYEYDPGTDTWGLVVDISVADAQAIGISGMCWFNGNLYFASDTSVDEIRVYRWNGSLNDITEVLAVDYTGTTIDYVRMYADDTYMVVIGVPSAAGGSPVVRYTTGGASWNSGSFATDPLEPGNGGFRDRKFGAEWPFTLYFQACTSYTGSDCTAVTLYSWNGSQWVVVNTGSLEGMHHMDPVTDGFFWLYFDSAYSTDDLATFDASSPVGPVQLHQINMPWQPAVEIATGTDLYQHDGAGAFTLFENIATLNLVGDIDGWVVRLNNGRVYIIDYEDAIYNNWIILERNDPLDPPTTGLEFWHGTNGPGVAKQCDLSFNTVTNPGCFVVRQDGTVFIGGADTGGVMVEKILTSDYTTPVDISGTLDTAKPIKGVSTT